MAHEVQTDGGETLVGTSERCGFDGCDRPAVYDIREIGTTARAGVDDDAYACEAHVAEMLGYSGEPLPGRTVQFVVTPIGGHVRLRP
jgi:hypothetical protein